MPGEYLINWQPRELIKEAYQRSLDVFLVAHDNCNFLLVLLDSLNSELAAGLLALEASRGETDTLGFRTSVRDVDSTQIEDKRPKKYERERLAVLGGNSGNDAIPGSLLKVPCHAVPIRKRSDGSFLQKVSIGRARNNDIVLRHSSVSKFHAWIEVQDDGKLMVKDSESRNHTYVDGQQITARIEVLPGQIIRFGSIEARVCTATSLWQALQT